MTNKLKELDKVGEIESALGKLYQSVNSQACSTLQQVKQNFISHELDFKTKLCSYVGRIRENLKTLAQEPSPMIGDLKKKIEELAGKKDGQRGARKNGKIEKLKEAMRKLERIHRGKSYGQLMTSGPFRQDEIKTLENNALMAQLFIERTFENFMSFDKTEKRLRDIIPMLEKYGDIGGLVAEIDKFNATNINEYYTKINEHERKIQNLNILGQYKRFYEGTLTKTKQITKILGEHKKNITSKRDKFKEEYIRAFEAVSDIQDKELNDITTKLGEIIDIVNTTQNFITNTKLFLEYLRTFESDKNKIDGLEIEGNSISDIQKTISSIEGIIRAITETQIPIHEAKQRLGGFKKTWGSDKTREDSMPGIKLQYFPEDLRVIEDYDPLRRHLKKLNAINYFNTVLEVSDPGTILNLLDIGEAGTNDIHVLLLKMSLIDVLLSMSRKVIDSQVVLIGSSHKSNKSKLNSTPNGKRIEEHVEKISEIPGKIAELHKSVKIYIRLTQIVSNVIKTLDKMNHKAGELRGTNGVVKNTGNCIESC